MANELPTVVIGNAVADPELVFLSSGAAKATVTIAQTPRVKKGDTWEDGETMFIRATAWRQTAENLVESVQKGTRLVAYGKLKTRSYEAKDGSTRMSLDLEVDEIGPSLRYATAKVAKVARSSGGGSGGGSNGAPADDPWASAPVGAAAVPMEEETPPF